MKFFKYLSKKPIGIAYYIFVLSIVIAVNYVLLTNGLQENSLGFFIFFMILINLIIFPIALYQPYKEYKDITKL